jgi:Carboxypeptidase regulatory-like domain/TonB-dependent Receptor Plug Domain
MSRTIQLGAVAGLCALSGLAQTTQGIIAGQVLDKLSQMPLQNATVACSAPGVFFERQTDARGFYIFPLLSPGTYVIRVDYGGYQSQEIAEQELPVAGRLEVNLALRPLYGRWLSTTDRFSYTRNERLVHFYATDADQLLPAEVEPADAVSVNLGSTLSYVIHSDVLEGLPLRGRDAYALLVALPGVTADNAIGRGLGISVNGQRPSASNFLLDGLENNNGLVTGNLTTIPPEGLQEYRISTNNFSAEYGRTSGFLANAITRTGGAEWHGYGYVYAKNEVLDANGYRVAPVPGLPLPRVPLSQIEPGFVIGGPVVKSKLFFSAASEVLRLRTYRDPVQLQLPSASFVASTPADSPAGRLLHGFQAPASVDGAPSALVILSPPSSMNQYLNTPRADAVLRDSALRLFLRASFSNLNRPDYNWTPYKDFVSPLTQNDVSVATGLVATWGETTNEVRAGWNRDNLHLDRTRAEVPVLSSFDFDQPNTPVHTTLPGSPLPYGYRNRNVTWQLVDNLTWTKARHIPKIGAGLLWRRIDSALTFLQSGEYFFLTLSAFQKSSVSQAFLPLAQTDLPVHGVPDFNRQYGYFQFSAFAQDTFKVTPKLQVSYGVRYENYGAPMNTGPAKDLVLQLGGRGSFPQRISEASFAPAMAGDQRLYDPDNNNVAVRAGFAWKLPGSRDFLVHGAYGVFYDRPFDNLWQNLADNNFALGKTILNTPVTLNYLNSPAQALAAFPGLKPDPNFPKITLFQPGFRDGYVHSYFLGLERSLTEDFTMSANFTGSAGRKLIATDLINRNSSLNPQNAQNPLPPIDYRSNQGGSIYNALTLTGHYRSSAVQAQVSYSWSHSIDNQSDALGGDFFNLGFTNPLQSSTANSQPAQFTRAFDSRVDRGNADFDQRHNLVVYSLWNLPPLFASSRAARWFRNWKLAELAALRSGFPFSVNTPYRFGDPIPVNRADLNASVPVYLHEYADGGRLLLNANAFLPPKEGLVGDTTRNEFRGPGLYSVDFSLGRTFHPAEAWRFTVRADAFNILNHANLNNPSSVLGSANGQFGVSLYGRKDAGNGFPGSVPLDETARQIQLSLRVEF